MTWNKKNDQFALMCGLRPSATLLLRWILRRAKLNQVDEIEIDLRQFNAWVAKNRGTPFDRKTIREAIAQLDEQTQGLIVITKNYTPWVKKVIVRPLEMVLRNNSSKQVESPKLATGNPMFGSDHKKTSSELLLQNISKIDTLFRKLGMKYTPDALMRIWRMAGKSLAEVKSAVAYMITYHSTKVGDPKCAEDKKGITSPKGWLHECLKWGWHHDTDDIILPVILDGSIHYFVASLAPDIRGSDLLPDPI
jgi:hypothetical protein